MRRFAFAALCSIVVSSLWSGVAPRVSAVEVRPQLVSDPIDRPGVSVLIAGTRSTESDNGDGGPAMEASMSSYITDIAVDSIGNVYMADRDWRQIRRIDAATGTITSVFDERGQSVPTYCNSPHTSAISGPLGYPWALATHGTDLYYSIGCDGGGRVRLFKRTAVGVVSLVAGGVYCPDTTANCTGDGGPALGAGLGSIDGLEVDASGNLYIADSTNCRVRRIDASTGLISTIGGTICTGGGVDDMALPRGDRGLAVEATFYRPSVLALSANERVLHVLSEGGGSNGRRVRAIDLDSGVVTTSAGTGFEGISGDGGPATQARIYPTNSIAVSASGELLLFSPGPVDLDSDVETPYSLIRKVGADGIIDTLARIEGPWPKGGEVGPDGSIYVVSKVTDTNFTDYFQLLKFAPDAIPGWQPPACTISGTSGDDELLGTPGNDVICGLAGNDTIDGNGGNDIIFGGEGDDVITCLSRCIVDGGPGNDTIDLGDSGGSADGGAGDDVLLGGDGSDSLVGDEGRDRIDGGGGDDYIDGGDGNDHVTSEGAALSPMAFTRSVVTSVNLVMGGEGDDWVATSARDAVFAGRGSDRCSQSSLFQMGCATAAQAAAEVPAAPRSVRSTLNGTSATVSWRTPSTSGGQALTYSVRVNGSVVSCASSTAATCTVNGLTAGATVTVEVRATNSSGAGAWSTAHAFTVSSGGGTGGGTGGGGGGGGGGAPAAGSRPVVPGAGGRARSDVSFSFGTVAFDFAGMSGSSTVTVTPRAGTPPEMSNGMIIPGYWLDVDIDGSSFETAEICVPVDRANLVAYGLSFDRLRLFHWADGVRVDATTKVDAADGKLCGRVEHFSPIAVGALRTRRLEGSDRFATSAAVSARFNPGKAATVFVTTGANFPDALSAGAAAAASDSPVLLVGRDSLSSAVRNEIMRLDPSKVVVVGGELAVSATVIEAIQQTVPRAVVSRVFGPDRYTTAVRVSEVSFAPEVPVVYVATGEGFADALAGAAAAGRDKGPLLLVPGLSSSLPVNVEAELRRLRPARVVILGGEAAVSSSMFSQIDALLGVPTPDRVAGVDRFDTAARLASPCVSDDLVFVATGTNFPDALSVSAAAGALGCPVLLTSQSLPRTTATALSRLAPGSIFVAGGPTAVGRNVESLVADFLPG